MNYAPKGTTKRGQRPVEIGKLFRHRSLGQGDREAVGGVGRIESFADGGDEYHPAGDDYQPVEKRT